MLNKTKENKWLESYGGWVLAGDKWRQVAAVFVLHAQHRNSCIINFGLLLRNRRGTHTDNRSVRIAN